MRRIYSFKLLKMFEGIIGKTKTTLKVRKLNKRVLPELKTKDLSSLNEILSNKLHLLCTPSLRNCSTTNNLIKLINEINDYIIKATSHNIK